MNESNTIASTSRTIEPMIDNQVLYKTQMMPNEMSIISEIRTINPNTYDINTLIYNLYQFNLKLKNLKYIQIIFTNEFLDILKQLAYKGNVRIDLALKSVYLTIISHESIFKNYLLFDENDIYRVFKINFLLNMIDECVFIIERLRDFIFDEELFIFKNKTLELLQCIYYNCRNKIKEEETLRRIQELLDSLPAKFYSSAYVELNKNKELYEVLKTQNLESIANFERQYLDVNNYFEQYEVFKKFMEMNSSDSVGENFTSVGDSSSINIDDNNRKISATKENIEFYHNYGILLLKFCKYHNYIFLNQIDNEEDKEEDEEGNEDARVVFLLDKFKQSTEKSFEIEKDQHYNSKDKKHNEKELLTDKKFQSVLDSKEYKKLIKKEITNYLNITKDLKRDSKIKMLREQMTYFISTLEADGYVPLYLKEFNKINISDNFSPAFSTNVPAGKERKLYLETIMNEKVLLYIEFFLEDKSKDITFEFNKYDTSSESFKQIFKEENVDRTFKLFVLCNGYSLYQIIFNNDYSWINSKDIYYQISLLKLLPNTKSKDILSFILDGKEVSFNAKEVVKKMINKEEEKEINIPAILFLNNLRIVTITKKDISHEDIEFEEIVEKQEKYIPKHLFDFSIINHLKKLKIKTNETKKIIISIYSQNRDLAEKIPEILDKIKNSKKPKSLKYLKKIGFFPTAEIGEYKVNYRLYDLCEQNLLYHLFLLGEKKDPLNKTILFLKFDKLVVNYAIYDKRNITIKLKEKLENNNQNNIEEYIFNFIKNVNKIYNGINLVMNYIDYKDEIKKKSIDGLIYRINKFVTEKLEPPVPVTVYEQNAIDIKVFKYMKLFYDE